MSRCLFICYALTNDSTKSLKVDFLQAVINDIPKDIQQTWPLELEILRNTKVGNDGSHCPWVLGSHDTGEQNEKTCHFIDFAFTNDFLIGSSLFAHKSIHKCSLSSPDATTYNRINHSLVNRRWRSSLKITQLSVAQSSTQIAIIDSNNKDQCPEDHHWFLKTEWWNYEAQFCQGNGWSIWSSWLHGRNRSRTDLASH